MDSIEAQRVKTVPGNLLMMRRAEEETANQCSNTKESTGAPVSASEQDSHSAARREPHSRHPEPLEAVVSADTRAFLEGGGVLASLANYNLVP